MGIKSKTKLSVAAAAIAALLSAAVACEPELTDSRTFVLSYPGISDIAPSTNINVTPTYLGPAPSDFSVSSVKLDGQKYETDCFSVDETTGVFYVRNSDSLPTGTYSIGISCLSGGKKWSFEDIITITMLKAAPEGVSVKPGELVFELGDLIDETSAVELPTARIETEGEHISIKKYIISSVRRNGVAVADFSELFSVSEDGEISVLRNAGFIPGEYKLDVKLTTYVVNEFSDDGIFADALTVKVTSAPLSLEYAPASGKAEFGRPFASASPALVGSPDGLVYSIKSISPEGAPVSIDPATGILSLPVGNSLPIGTSCLVGVTVTNQFGSKDFDSAFSLDVVAVIAPITHLNYTDLNIIEGGAVDNAADADGDEVSYSFENLPAALEGVLAIDPVTGKVSMPKGNSVPVGSYTVSVVAENPKGTQKGGFKLVIEENIYKFTYVHWGNNLGLSPSTDYANQFKVSTTETNSFPVISSDIRSGVTAKFSLQGGSNSGFLSINPDTGELTTDPTPFAGVTENMRVHFRFVVVTTGEGTPGETTVNIPVFFNFHCAHDGIEVDYVPFVFQCNPRTGGVSAAPVITGAEASTFTLDYRRSFNYYNVAGPASHVNGQPSVAGAFLNTMWKNFYSAINIALNTGSRDPVSFYGRPGKESSRLCYPREDHAVLVNPEKWKDDAGYANGIFIGQITFGTTGTDPASAAAARRIFPLAIWFDTAFDND